MYIWLKLRWLILDRNKCLAGYEQQFSFSYLLFDFVPRREVLFAEKIVFAWQNKVHRGETFTWRIFFYAEEKHFTCRKTMLLHGTWFYIDKMFSLWRKCLIRGQKVFLGDLDFHLSWLHKVKSYDVVSLLKYDFLWMFNGNLWPNSAPVLDTNLQSLSNLEFNVWKITKAQNIMLQLFSLIWLPISVYNSKHISTCISRRLAVIVVCKGASGPRAGKWAI